MVAGKKLDVLLKKVDKWVPFCCTVVVMDVFNLIEYNDKPLYTKNDSERCSKPKSYSIVLNKII